MFGAKPQIKAIPIFGAVRMKHVCNKMALFNKNNAGPETSTNLFHIKRTEISDWIYVSMSPIQK